MLFLLLSTSGLLTGAQPQATFQYSCPLLNIHGLKYPWRFSKSTVQQVSKLWAEPNLHYEYKICAIVLRAQPDIERNVPSMWDLVVFIQQSMTSYKKDLDLVICYPWKFRVLSQWFNPRRRDWEPRLELDLSDSIQSEKAWLASGSTGVKMQSPTDTHMKRHTMIPGSLLWQSGILNFRGKSKNAF